MDILNNIIRSLTKEEVRQFKLLSTRMQSKGDRKDLLLFDTIRNSKNYDEKKTATKLYGKNKNGFYRLKNRLGSSVNKSILVHYFESDEQLDVWSQLNLYHIFKHRKQHEVAYSFLRKAERLAVKNESYELLEIIYYEMIKLYDSIEDINPEEVMRKRNANAEMLQNISEIDQVLAYVVYQLHKTQNFSSGDPVNTFLEKTIQKVSSNKNLLKNQKLQFRIYEAVSKNLLQKYDYVKLEEYLLLTYKKFSQLKWFDKKNHDSKLQMITYIVNSLFKNKKYKLSLQYAELLGKEIRAYDDALFDKYYFFYINSQVINYAELDVKKAISLLEELKKHPLQAKQEYYKVFTYLNLGIFYFNEMQLDKSISHFHNLTLLKAFKNLDPALQLKISVTELMVRYDMQELQILEYRMNQIKRTFKKLLAEKKFEREHQFLKILSLLINCAQPAHDTKLLKKIDLFVALKPMLLPDDSEITSYNKWLQSKTGKKRK